MKLKVMIRNEQRTMKLPRGIRLIVRKCCYGVLEYEGFGKDAEVSVSFEDDFGIRRLNRVFRDIDRPTDVLSFPLGENGEYDVNAETGALLLGDIVISAETAARQAYEYGHSFEREIGFLTVHSMLHLLGYDHETSEEDAREMHRREEEILTGLSLIREGSHGNENEG